MAGPTTELLDASRDVSRRSGPLPCGVTRPPASSNPVFEVEGYYVKFFKGTARGEPDREWRGLGWHRRTCRRRYGEVCRHRAWLDSFHRRPPEVANERGVNFWSKVGFRKVRIVNDDPARPLLHMEWARRG